MTSPFPTVSFLSPTPVLNQNPTAMILVFDAAEEVQAWVLFATDGVVEEVFVLPGAEGSLEDLVYYVVNRTVNGATVRYVERWAQEIECRGGTLNKNLDSHVIYQGSPTTTLTAAHLVGKTVGVWGDGKDQGTYTVSGGGTITLPVAVSNAVVGLLYEGAFQSAKLAYATQKGSALTKRKLQSKIGVVLDSAHTQGLQYGKDFTSLQFMPLIEDGAPIDPTGQWQDYDKDMFSFDGEWDTDTRICLYALSPRNVTILAVTMDLDTTV